MNLLSERIAVFILIICHKISATVGYSNGRSTEISLFTYAIGYNMLDLGRPEFAIFRYHLRKEFIICIYKKHTILSKTICNVELFF